MPAENRGRVRWAPEYRAAGNTLLTVLGALITKQSFEYALSTSTPSVVDVVLYLTGFSTAGITLADGTRAYNDLIQIREERIQACMAESHPEND